MIGETPKGAPLRCKLGRHVRKGFPEEGLSCYFCERCGGTYWQDKDYSAEIAAADLAGGEVAERASRFYKSEWGLWASLLPAPSLFILAILISEGVL